MEGNNISIDEFFYSLPIGFRFAPTDEELILYYLKKKLLNEPLPINRFLEINIYQYHPQVLTGIQNLIREDGWYCFTPRDRKYRNGSRPNRAASDIGYWKATGKDKAILVENEVIGYKRTLDFYNGNHDTGLRSKWKMIEYRVYAQQNIPPPPPNNRKAANNINEDMKLDDCVLCKIYVNTRPDKNKNNDDNDNTNNAEATVDSDNEGGPSHYIDQPDQDQSGPSDANLTSDHDIDQPQDHESIEPDQDDQSSLIGNSNSTYCAMPTSTITLMMEYSNFGEPAAYYDQSQLSLLQGQALPYYSGPTFPYYSGPTFPYYSGPTNSFNDQPYYSTYNNIDYSAHMSQTDESFSSPPEYYSIDDHEIISTNVEMLQLANQMPLVDSTSIPLPWNVREYEQSLKKVMKEW